MNVKEYIKASPLYLDGGMGTLLQESGLGAGELPERLNLTAPELITDIHRAYFNAGANVVNTNTFGASLVRFSDSELREIIFAAVRNASDARDTSGGDRDKKWVALDIGPLGRMLEPYGDLSFENAVSTFRRTVELGVEAGVDLVFIETMNDIYEARAALLAAKEACDLPVFVSCAYGEDGRLMTGATPDAVIATLEGMGADAIGVNCSLGPRAVTPVVRRYIERASVPVIFKPNAGLPTVRAGKTTYDVTPEDFARDIAELFAHGATVVGGCCGTTPEYIAALVSATSGITPTYIEKKSITVISSQFSAVTFDDRPIIIGERINPTGKKRFKEALRSGNVDYILKEGIDEEEAGADVLDVNVGLPEVDEPEMLTRVVRGLQSVVSIPLQLDTSDPRAMESALRIYNGKPLINSVNGKKESLHAILPLAKKYGGVIIALTLDEEGIPPEAEGRVAIARRILHAAGRYGIDKKDIIFDPLALSVSADPASAIETARAVRIISEELGCHTSLGVSNISFGLPERDALTASFLTLAMQSGLSAAILNPHSESVMRAYHSYLALTGRDTAFTKYIAYSEAHPITKGDTPTRVTKNDLVNENTLTAAIVRGIASEACRITSELLNTVSGLDIINGEIIPALNTVGEGFERGKVYLPSLLLSAEAASAAFEVIKSAASDSSATSDTSRVVVLATVKGDIHDIGKNIVKLLLESYGFTVVDLGRDVPAERVIEAARTSCARLVGLSALMTTTVPAMEETVTAIHASLPGVRVMVGGAVLTEEYAASIGADKYAKDAMEGVRYAEVIYSV